MNGSAHPLPLLALTDFGPGLNHVAEALCGGKVFAVLRRDDPARAVLPHLTFAANDPSLYLFVHGGDEATRFQDWRDNAIYEIPATVLARLLEREYGSALVGTSIRVGACYGNLLRPGDAATAVQTLARELPQVSFEGYHGLVRLRVSPPELRLGATVIWDPLVGPLAVGPPGNWEPVAP